jgi:hypothetical protein
VLDIPGVDYSAGRPGGAALAKAGQKYAARYLSHTASKNLTPAEAADLAAHGVSVVVVWETTANRAGAGRAAGVADAKEALAQARACGMPAGRPIYFAVDWDANPAVVAPYFQGVLSVLGLKASGGYGGFKVIKYLLDNRLISWAWQTVAWSAGRWDARAVLRQPGTTTHINGVDCDRDIATASDYGQWMPGRSPSEVEDDMEKTDKLTIRKGAWADHDETDTVEAWVTNGNKKAERAADNSGKAVDQLAALTTKVDNLTKQVAALKAAPVEPLDYTKLATALVAQFRGGAA